ncbi:VOC family protein [Fulvivirga sp.]|uniref:VOC family protein n=1 Tax=Fulvivirga sp. TaxID=1931237 RepID=UPI0032ECE757
MTDSNSYITFNGNCAEAMNFYHKCFGGTLDIQTVGQSPVCDDMPTKMKNSVLHSYLNAGPLKLMATDMVGNEAYKRGNNMAIVLHFESEQALRKSFELLTQDGQTIDQVHETFWGALYGCLTDKFGIRWLLNYQYENIKTN